MALSAQPSEWADVSGVPFSFPAKYAIAGWNLHPVLAWPGQYEGKAAITRYSGTGVLDTSFGTNGSTEETGSSSYPNSRYFSVRIGLSGKIVTGGHCGTDSFYYPPYYYGSVARYWGN